MDASPPEFQPRQTCYRCFKPSSMCICASLEPIANEVAIHVLQHPRERHHPIGTARLLRLGLSSVRVHVLKLIGKGGTSAPVALPEGAGLLYPSADARDLATLAVEDRPRDLVVIDGTWAHANQIHRDNEWVSALPCYRLTPQEESRYRIRAEPRPDCLSTVESVVGALRCLQPDLSGTETLLTAFDAMIDAQIEASARPSRHSKKRARLEAARAVPDALRAPGARILVVYTERAPPVREPDAAPRGVIRISAVTLDGARQFDRMVQAERAPDAYLRDRMGLEADAMDSARPAAEVVLDFQEFCDARRGGPGSDPGERELTVLATWEPRIHRWLQACLPEVPAVLLKGAWGNMSRVRVGGLEDIVQALGVAVPEGRVTGRAGRRLMLACAMTHHLRDVGFDGA
jgi:DTW domain-containing protein